MLGQLRVEPEPELELDPLDPELELEPELDEPLLVLPDPALPELELDEGVVVEEPEVEEFEVELEPVPVLPVLEVVAALATSAPPAKRPEVSAPTASTLRRRICMGCCPFIRVLSRPLRAGTAHDAPATCGVPQSFRNALVELSDDPMTIHRFHRSRRTAQSSTTHSGLSARARWAAAIVPTLRRALGSAGARSACRRGSSAGWNAGWG
jgi:hypothetical protein